MTKPKMTTAVRWSAVLCRIVCKWKGHDEVNDLKAWECLRCGLVMDYDEAVKTPWRERLRYWLRSKKDWVALLRVWSAIRQTQ